MTDVLPQMRHFLRKGPVTKTVDSPYELFTHRTTNANTTTDPSKIIRALLPQMDAIGRRYRRNAALSNPHADDFPIPRTARVSQPRWHSARSGPESLLRCLHNAAAGPDCSAAGVLDDVGDFAVVERGVLAAGA